MFNHINKNLKSSHINWVANEHLTESIKARLLVANMPKTIKIKKRSTL